jgi:hypothetical protein
MSAQPRKVRSRPVEPDDLIANKTPKALHLNVRLAGDDAEYFAELQRRAPRLTQSQVFRDAVRMSLFVLLKQERKEEVPESVAQYLNVFK